MCQAFCFWQSFSSFVANPPAGQAPRRRAYKRTNARPTADYMKKDLRALCHNQDRLITSNARMRYSLDYTLFRFAPLDTSYDRLHFCPSFCYLTWGIGVALDVRTNYGSMQKLLDIQIWLNDCVGKMDVPQVRQKVYHFPIYCICLIPYLCSWCYYSRICLPTYLIWSLPPSSRVLNSWLPLLTVSV